MASSCFRVAVGVFPANSASDISCAVMGLAALRSTSTADLYRVPRLNQGLPVFRRRRGRDVFSETQSEIEHLKAQIAQSELIVAASEKTQG
jgi:hypothetical protein